MPRQPTDEPTKFVPPPVTIREVTKKPGRPKALGPMPQLKFQFRNDDEEELYGWAQAAIKHDYPDLRPSEEMLVPLAAAEFVKFCRLLASELSTGELVTMSRQHPGNMFARLMQTMLGTTRTNRIKNGDTKDEDETPWYTNLNAAG